MTASRPAIPGVPDPTMAGSLPLFQVRVRVPEGAAEPVAACFEEAWGTTAVVYVDAETRVAEVSVYRESAEPGPSRAGLDRLREALNRLRVEGALVRVPRVGVRRLRRADWAESWKRHFQARLFGGRVWVRPSWSRRRPGPGQVEVVLDPGLSFGTGQHATTAFCLEQLVAALEVSDGVGVAGNEGRARRKERSFLDAGTGSGILAIAAAKLGYGRVEGFDFDPAAVRVAGENAAVNRVADRIRLRAGDVRRLSRSPRRRHDVVAANLLAELLIAERDRLVAQVAPGGWLILAGILESQFGAVQAAYAQAGWRVRADRIGGEWRSGVFVAGVGGFCR